MFWFVGGVVLEIEVFICFLIILFFVCFCDICFVKVLGKVYCCLGWRVILIIGFVVRLLVFG